MDLQSFFDDKEIFWDLTDHYDKDNYRFSLETFAERNQSIKLLESAASMWTCGGL